MLILIIESSSEYLEKYSDYLEKYLSKRKIRVLRINFGEKINQQIDVLIVKGSFFSYKGQEITIDKRMIFGDYFLIFKSSKVNSLPFKKLGIDIYEFKDKTFPISVIKFLNLFLQNEAEKFKITAT